MTEDSQDPIPQIRDKAPKPPGVLPKNVQAWVLIGVATVMVCVLALSGGRSPQPGSTDPAHQNDAVVDPNEARIQEYRNRLEAEARKLEAERERLKQATAALTMEPAEPEPSTGPPPFSSYGYSRQQPERATTQKSALEQEKERREYDSLFASSVALTYRKDRSPAKSSPGAVPAPQAVAAWPTPYPGAWPANQPAAPPAESAKEPSQPKAPPRRPNSRQNSSPPPASNIASSKAHGSKPSC